MLEMFTIEPPSCISGAMTCIPVMAPVALTRIAS